MLPYVLNDDPSRLVEIRMSGSVGRVGANMPADVKLVQSMLNNVPSAEGGPTPALTVDGLAGPKTVEAIMRFQRAARLRAIDGRVDPARATITALGRLLNKRNLLPRGIPGIGPPDARVRQALAGAGRAAPRSSKGIAVGGGFQPLGRTDWQFASSSGLGLGIDVFGVTAMRFHLVKDSQPGFIRIFPFGGIGAGLSAMPVTLDLSFADMPSFGLRIRQGPFGGANPMPEDDFIGPCTVVSVGASVGPGVSGTLCLFGAAGPFTVTSHAIGFIAGMEAGLPGASITGFFGLVGKPLT